MAEQSFANLHGIAVVVQVKSCFFLTRGPMPAAELVRLDKSNHDDILKFWQQQLREKPQFKLLMEAAHRLNYEGVIQGLAAKLE